MKKIGKYIVRGLLGRGGMSVVYKVLLPVVRKTVALKWFSPHPTLIGLWGEETMRDRFMAEAALMGSIRHPHVVEILDFDFMKDTPFFTMEYHSRTLGMLMGEGLRTDAECRRLPLDDAIRFARQLLSGLGRLHRAGLVHRDIKPHNLLLNDEGQLKVGDLGLSKLRGEISTRTPAGLVVGSPFYAAPEQVRNPDGVDPRADMYSAGVVIHRMITGRFPEEMDGRPSQDHPDADDGWDDFLAKAVHEDPGMRFSGAGEMLQALDELDEAWKEKRSRFCGQAGPAATPMDAMGSGESLLVRRDPVKVAPDKAHEVFSCDGLWRPLHYRKPVPYQRVSSRSLRDEAKGLTWQSNGSEDPMSWQDAAGYVARLNADAFCGTTHWRLPTVDEVFTTLDAPLPDRSHCAESVFDSTKTCVWTSDRRSYGSAWYVDVELGFAGWADFSSFFFVRAVSSGPF